MNSKAYERAAIVGTVDPANLNNATTLTDAIDMMRWRRVMFILLAGANDSTVDFKVQESATSGGSYTDISGKAITQETGGDDDNKQWIIEVSGEELGDGMRYIKGSVTMGNGTTNMGAVVALGFDPREYPAQENDLSTVSQIV